MLYWDRPTIKDRAKAVLRTSYWVSLLVTFLYGLLMGGSSGSSFRFDFSSCNYTSIGQFFEHIQFSRILTIFSGLLWSSAVIGIFLSVFVYRIFEIGKARYFFSCRYGAVQFGEVFCGFKGGHYLNNVKTMFLRDLYVFLWSLLLIVPGIIKGYSYWMVPYILAENPNLSTQRVLEISERTMQGEKWETFVLQLSFIGWYLLGMLACGVGIVFVAPYAEATYAELYGALRAKAVNTGICTRAELGADVA